MKRIILILIPLIILFALVGWRYSIKTRADAASKKLSANRKNAATVVSISTAKPLTISQRVIGVGSLESPYTVKLSPNVAGRIDFLQVREGDQVKAGQVLAKIDPQEVEGEILQAQAALAEAQQRLSQATITQNSTAVGIFSAINQNKALVASTGADYNETAVTYDPTVNAAHQSTLDYEAKVTSAQSQVDITSANMRLSQANLDDAQAKYARELNLYQQGYATAQDIDDAKASLQVNEATVHALQKTVDAAKSALSSAEAEEKATANQEAITRKKGRSDIQDAKAKWTQSKATLSTAVSNRAQIPAYTENLRALSAAVLAAKGSLNQAIARRSYLIVKSSIEGTVTQRLADPGAEASPGTPILVLQYLKWVYLTAAVPVDYADSVKPGLAVRITLDSLANRVFHAKIVDVNRAADPTTRQFMIRVRLDNSEHLFRPGMYARISMITSVVHADVAVPREAVNTSSNGLSTVTAVDASSIAHVIPVTLGVQDPNNIQILKGVSVGDKVVTLSYRPVKDKGKVVEGKLGANAKEANAKGGAETSSSPPGAFSSGNH